MILPRETEEGTGGEGRLARITHFTLYERVYEELCSAIMDGIFASGETLTIRSIAQQLGTSAMPAREALRRLATEGALEILPNKSIRIPEANAERVEEICRLRILLETEAVGLAAKKLSEAQILQLRRLHRRFVQSVKSGLVSDFLHVGQDFHFTIYQAAESPILVTMIRALWLQSGPWLAEPLKDTVDRRTVKKFTEGVAKHHQNIFDALEARDGARAVRAIRSELEGHLAYMRDFVKDHVEAPARRRSI